jgi:hypothetical protein
MFYSCTRVYVSVRSYVVYCNMLVFIVVKSQNLIVNYVISKTKLTLLGNIIIWIKYMSLWRQICKLRRMCVSFNVLEQETGMIIICVLKLFLKVHKSSVACYSNASCSCVL